MSVSQQQQQQQRDPCDDAAPASVAATAVYNPATGTFVYPPYPDELELVVSGTGTSALTLIPASTPGYSDADALVINSSHSWTKAYMGGGQIVVIFPHPSVDCETHQWILSFRGFIGTPMTVKVRKTRGSRLTGKEGSESPK